MWISREIETTLLKINQERPALILTGARQTGKTSLLQKVFPQYNYVTLDIPLEAAQAEESGEQFLQNHPCPLIIDEVQYAPKLLRYIKAKIDSQRNLNGQFLLTGSQKFELMEKITESLAGRVAILLCYSLSCLEYEKSSGKKIEGNTLWEWIWKGGYPELHAKDLSPQRFFSDYLVTYLERDVRQIVQVKNLRDFDRFLRLCAVRTGQLLSLSSLASDIGVSPLTIKSWLNVLESSNIIYLLEPYYQNLGKRLVKTPKLYFLDTGLASFLAGFKTEKDLQESPLKGAFFETHVLGQILRFYQNRGETPSLYFYRDHFGHEVDFLIPIGNRFKLIECKSQDFPSPEVGGFKEIEKTIGTDRILIQTLITPARGSRKISANFFINDSVNLENIL